MFKHVGSHGVLTQSYPDYKRKYVKDKWIRMASLVHDFSESVCEGWQGFYDAEDSIKLFEETGFNVYAVMLNASIWRLDKP